MPATITRMAIAILILAPTSFVVACAASSADGVEGMRVLSRESGEEVDAATREEVLEAVLPEDQVADSTDASGTTEVYEAGAIVLPYSLDNVFSTFSDCRKDGTKRHAAIDIGGVGEDAGNGTPIFAMTRSKVTLIGTPEVDEGKFGEYDTRSGTEERRNQDLPRSAEIEDYGTVYFFTRDAGSWRSGVVLVTEGLEGDLEGYRIRYMHLAAIHPDLQEGDIIEPGQEIGLMGGTGFHESLPHLHLDIEDPDGDRVDPAPYLGLDPDDQPCPR